MCAEGIAIGRSLQPITHEVVTVPTTGIEVAPADGGRVGLVVAVTYDASTAGHQGVHVGYFTGSTFRTLAVLDVFNKSVYLDVERYGPALLGPIAVKNTVADTITASAVSFRLNAPVEAFRGR